MKQNYVQQKWEHRVMKKKINLIYCLCYFRHIFCIKVMVDLPLLLWCKSGVLLKLLVTRVSDTC